MQFREQGRKLQCIRSTYDPATKRSHQRVVATLPRYAEKMPSVGLDVLTEDERKELAEHLQAKREDGQRDRNQRAIRGVAGWLDGTAQALTEGELMTASEAAATWAAMAKLAKALRKAGHPKPVKRPRSPQATP